MSEQGARPAATAGVMTAAAVVYALAAIYLPMLTMMMGLLWPVFIALVTVREGLRWGMLAAAASLLLTMLFATPVTGAFFVLSFAPTGLVLGALFRRGADPMRALVGGGLASLAGKAAAAGMMFLIFGLNPFDISMANETMDETLAVYRSLGMNEAQLEETRAASAQVLELFVLMLPALFLGSSVIEVTACFVVLRKVLHRLGIPAARLPAFTEWRLPVFFSYLFAFSLIGIYWGTTRDIAWLYQAALNGYLISFIAGLVQGISLMQFLMQRFQVSSFVRVLIYVFIALNGFMAQIISWTGLFDIAVDYRKKFRKSQ
ncbi:hypothetical protein BCS37_11090 [Selenomonas sp. oral taxon 920]|uniref:YybS family protein n=1 Tax=Selenomonas sp. oral taxon 920 TaxID=1884263 RepID=UPI000840E8C8|nr:YybS family protein [Selenomonas sp. oral taxon 920]AOH48938.1 hypothetical protein BCS37_11090 [Selenomonas sp. oral taxon 920]